MQRHIQPVMSSGVLPNLLKKKESEVDNGVKPYYTEGCQQYFGTAAAKGFGTNVVVPDML